MLIRILTAGLVSGFIMAGFLRLIERTTGKKVYTLLLNVDYLPIVNQVTGNEPVELALHMIVAIFVSWFVAVYILERWTSTAKVQLAIIMFSLLIGIMLYPSTILSERTPSILDGVAWFWWLTAHLLYGWVLAILLQWHKPTESTTE